MRIVTFLIFLLPLSVAAQKYYIAVPGLSMNAAMKIGPGDNQNWFAAYEPAVQVQVSGADRNSLGFTGSMGILIDPIRYNQGSGSRFTIIQHNVTFTGLIHFPTRKVVWDILTGIGLDFGLEPGLSIGTFTNHNTQTSLSMDLDSNFKLINDTRRRILPSVSAGASYTLLNNRRLKIYGLLKQSLLSLFTEDIHLLYKVNHSRQVAVINYKPSYIKLGLSYDFW